MKNDFELVRGFIDEKLVELADERKLLEPKITMKIRFKKCHPAAVMPKRGTTGAAGFDLTAVSENWKDGYVIYDTGIAIEIPAGHVGLLYEKVEIVAEGTKAKMAELEASNKQLREIICEFAHYLACPAYVLRPGTTKTIIDIAAEEMSRQ